MFKMFLKMFIRFDRVHERDGRTDRHRATAYATLMHSIARQKYISATDVSCTHPRGGGLWVANIVTCGANDVRCVVSEIVERRWDNVDERTGAR